MTGHPEDCDCWPCVLRPAFNAGYRLGWRKGHERGRKEGWWRGYEAAVYKLAEAEVAQNNGHEPSCPCAKCVDGRAEAATWWLESSQQGVRWTSPTDPHGPHPRHGAAAGES